MKTPQNTLHGGRETVAARRAQILAAAYNIAKEGGLAGVTQSAVAKRLGISRPLVVKYFKAADLTGAVVLQAVAEGDLFIIAEGLAARVPEAIGAPEPMKRAAVEFLLK